jgi:hypothetical protein
MSGRIIGKTEQGYPIVETYHCFLDSGGSCPHTAPAGVSHEASATEYAALRARRTAAIGNAATNGYDDARDPLLAGDVLGLTLPVAPLAGAAALGRQAEVAELPVEQVQLFDAVPVLVAA